MLGKLLQSTCCTALSFQVKEGSKGIICHGGEKLPGISKPHLSSSARKTEINIADRKAGIKSYEFEMWI